MVMWHVEITCTALISRCLFNICSFKLFNGILNAILKEPLQAIPSDSTLFWVYVIFIHESLLPLFSPLYQNRIFDRAIKDSKRKWPTILTLLLIFIQIEWVIHIFSQVVGKIGKLAIVIDGIHKESLYYNHFVDL